MVKKFSTDTNFGVGGIEQNILPRPVPFMLRTEPGAPTGFYCGKCGLDIKGVWTHHWITIHCRECDNERFQPEKADD